MSKTLICKNCGTRFDNKAYLTKSEQKNCWTYRTLNQMIKGLEKALNSSEVVLKRKKKVILGWRYDG